MKVLLVDGVGNAVIHDDPGSWLPTRVLIGPHQFLKTDQTFDELPISRLRGAGTPAIRHVNQHLTV